MTRPTALSDERYDSTSFLAISRHFLGLAAAAPASMTVAAGVDHVAEADPIPRSISASSVETSHRQVTANRYRKVAQSLLLATGLGALIPGQAFASQEFWDMGEREARQERQSKTLAQHHQQLHKALQLTAEQEPSWEKVLASEQPRQSVETTRTKGWAMLSVPERAEKMLELSKLRQAQLTEHVAALKSFYVMLSPDQKKSFDAFHAGMSG